MTELNFPAGLARSSSLRLLLAIAIIPIVSAGVAYSANITGMITVKQRLTRPSVTPAQSIYQRGPSVELERDTESDPLAAERARVVIWVEAAGSAKNSGAASPGRSEGTTASMQQLNRRFDPDIVVIPMGSSVTFPNMDPIFHNVFSLSRPRSFDLGNYAKGSTRTVAFPAPGIVYVNCRLHPNMSGVVVVTPNQWYANAGRDGQYVLHDLPPGIYTVVAWHKTTGFVRKQIQVVEGRDSVADFLVPIDTSAADTGAGMSHMKEALR